MTPIKYISTSLTNKKFHTRFSQENLKFDHKGQRDDQSGHAHRHDENQSAGIYTKISTHE